MSSMSVRLPYAVGAISVLLGASLLAARPQAREDPEKRVALARLAIPQTAAGAAAGGAPGDPFQRELRALAADVRGAHFSRVLDRGGALRELLRELDPETSVPIGLEVELELHLATAALALNAPEAAARALRWALTLDPDLELDARQQPRKLIAALEHTRADAARARSWPTEASELGGPGDAAPVLVRGSAPRTPPGASTSLRPTIVCRLLVDAYGAVVEARVYLPRPELRAFEEAALRAVRRFEFVPARSAGAPVAAFVQWPVSFR